MKYSEHPEHRAEETKSKPLTWTDEALPLVVRRSLLKLELERIHGERAGASRSEQAEPGPAQGQ